MKTLVEYINAVKGPGQIKIFAGEGNCHIYNDPEVSEAFKKARKNGIEIKMIIGPILSVSEETGHSLLIDLAKDTIEMYCRPYRHTLPHYTVTKDLSGILCYVESPHSCLEEVAEIFTEKDGIWAQKFDRDFDEFIKAYNLQSCRNLEEVLIPLKPSQIKELKKRSKLAGKDAEYLYKDEIETIMN